MKTKKIPLKLKKLTLRDLTPASAMNIRGGFVTDPTVTCFCPETMNCPTPPDPDQTRHCGSAMCSQNGCDPCPFANTCPIMGTYN
jgi:hypothetical protein